MENQLFLSPKKTAELGITTLYHIRLLIANDDCPGVRVGTHFKVNVPALREKLEADSRAAMQKGV